MASESSTCQRYLEWLLTIAPADFEKLVGRLAEGMGYRDVRTTGRSGDGGVDVEATRMDEWGAQRLALVQVKRHAAPLRRKYVDELLGVLTRRRSADGILITCSDFTPQAVAAARDVQQLSLVNGPQLVQLLAVHGVGLRFGQYREILSTDA